jgi:hypothetical protein
MTSTSLDDLAVQVPVEEGGTSSTSCLTSHVDYSVTGVVATR